MAELLKVGETVRIKSGPFASFTGVVKEVRSDPAELKVAVEVWGEVTTVDVPVADAERAPPTPPLTGPN